MRVTTLADADANDGGEPLRGSFLMGSVTPQFVPAAHHCGVCTVVFAFGDVVERPCGGGRWGGSGGRVRLRAQKLTNMVEKTMDFGWIGGDVFGKMLYICELNGDG